jgi:hypothetical protein
MAIHPQYRWMLLTAGVVGVLLAISALALDRRDVVWTEAGPRCPHCRSKVERYSYRCAVCREEYDWAVSPEEDSPHCPYCVSAMGEQHLTQRIQALTLPVAAKRAGDALGWSAEAAQAYLKALRRGRCGYCAGTWKDLRWAGPKSEECPVCFGDGACIACEGDGRLRLGDWPGARDLARLRLDVAGMPSRTPLEARRAEVRRLAKEFLDSHAGTEAAASLPFWAAWREDGGGPPAAEEARLRVVRVLDALDAP